MMAQSVRDCHEVSQVFSCLTYQKMQNLVLANFSLRFMVVSYLLSQSECEILIKNEKSMQHTP